MSLVYPPTCDTPRRRVEFCFRARELLRLLHNKMGYWYRPSEPDITQTQYDNNFPSPKFDRIRARYPFAPKLTQVQWNDFLKNVYEVTDQKINVQLSQNVQSVMDASDWTPDLEDIHGSL